MPLVSIYVPTYNRIELLRRALSSVLSQSYQNIEVIVVDDKSSDGTQAFLTEMAKQDVRVKPILKQLNSGACISRNLAIESAKGEFITGLDDDDYFLPGRIAYFVENRHLLIKYSFLYTQFLILTKNGQHKKTRYLNIVMPNEISSQDLLFKNIIGNQCFTYTQRIKEAGKFTPDMPAWQDMDLFYRLLNHSELKKARLLRQSLYVQDTSHDLNRITLSNKDKIHRAFTLFCERNQVSGKNKDILEVQLVSYGMNVRNSLFLTRLRWNTKLYFYLVDAFLFFKNQRNN
jgi:glycosyltransferase involved in cell wall biosynthesis